MSRLDSFIRRVSAQRDCLNMVSKEMQGRTGIVLEFGLGNGRTYDHLRSLFGPEDIYVFDRQVNAHPDCIPDDDHMILGDVLQTLPAFVDRFEGRAKLAHCDIGTGDKEASIALAMKMSVYLNKLVQTGGYIVSDQDIQVDGWVVQPLPEGVKPGRYFIYQKT
ncbi:class I SAM-dependent methyltransferase [Sneathiella glossodoripedis]|uniref:class I SAM-dependent methyltransferase n=1 Tax=Sneathiella glossodoripedis TaxID=418853 RepID=UPI00046E8164|nr:class I SAM-dependent methyltransferase [Sneathiella glossodoripedis]